MKKGNYIERLLLSMAFAILIHLILVQMIIGNLCRNVNYNGSVLEVEYISPFTANNFKSEDVDIDRKRDLDKKREDAKEDTREDEVIEENKEEGGQVVYLGETESDRAPDKYKYIAEHNSVVEKETKSRYARDDYKNPAPRPQMGENIAKNIDIRNGEKRTPTPNIIIKTDDKSDKQGRDDKDSSKIALKLPRLLKSEELMLEESDTGVAKKSKYSEALNGKDDEFQFGTGLLNGEELHQKRLAQLFPDDIFSGKYSGGPFSDWLKDVEESDATFLNAKEYKYASFFNRIKRTVSQYWKPSEVILKYDPYGNIYGNKDRLTIVKVRIDSTGSLKEIDVSQSSGVDFLDKVAVEAFKAAQPFPNPPKGLMDKNGEITFNFGFYIEFSKSSLRLFKYE